MVVCGHLGGYRCASPNLPRHWVGLFICLWMFFVSFGLHVWGASFCFIFISPDVAIRICLLILKCARRVWTLDGLMLGFFDDHYRSPRIRRRRYSPANV